MWGISDRCDDIEILYCVLICCPEKASNNYLIDRQTDRQTDSQRKSQRERERDKDVALNQNRNSTPRSNRVQQPPPRPVRKHRVPPERTSRRQQQSHMLRPSQPTPEHLLPALTSSHSVNQARPKPLLPTPYPPDTQQAPGSHSYAQIVSRKPTTAPVQVTTTELRDIRQMLKLICSHLLS